MIAVEYRCGCGQTGEMVEFTAVDPTADFPSRQFYINCRHCRSQTFRFDSPQATEMNWAAMDGHAVEYTREERCRVA